MIRCSVAAYGAAPAMCYRENRHWISVSYAEMGARIDCLSKALIGAGINAGGMAGIFSPNRPEWSVADFAILSAGAITVPIFATSTAKQVEYIVNDAGISLIFTGDAGQYRKVKSLLGSMPGLKTIVVFDRKVPIEGSESVYYDDFVKAGESSAPEGGLAARLERTSSGDVATLIYTSGTTGDPKGVMLTHANFLSQFDAIDVNFSVGTADRSLCFLPLSHALERTWSYYVFRQGAVNHYVSDPGRVASYLGQVRPTAMVSVPRLYEKIYSTVFDRLEKSSPARRKLFHWAIRIGGEYANKKKEKKFTGPWLTLAHAAADRLVLSKIRDIVGGPKNFLSSGGAALSREIEEFFFAAGLLICEGYGLTESSPMISYNTPNFFKFGTVGKAIPGCRVKLSDEGEILAKGPNIMMGYYNNPGETAKTIVDGWLHTGDVGVIDDEGFITITDRIKDLIITSQGKNVAPQHIEATVGKDHLIEQLCCVGDGRKFIAALVVPSFPALEEYAGKHGIGFSSREELIAKPEVVALYKTRIREQSSDLAPYESIRKFALLPKEFTQDAGEITPTLKIRRKAIMEKYKNIIDRMYEGGDGE